MPCVVCRWVSHGAGLQGAQAEFVRVPLADSTLVRVPETLKDDEVNTENARTNCLQV
jgi:hypothetical protein